MPPTHDKSKKSVFSLRYAEPLRSGFTIKHCNEHKYFIYRIDSPFLFRMGFSLSQNAAK